MKVKDNDRGAEFKSDRDIFVERFFLGGARRNLRKTTCDGPWLSLGIMENMNPDTFYDSRLFAEMNVIGGGMYSLGHGMIHGYTAEKEQQQIELAVKNLNALPTNEIVFYHDESMCGLEQARSMGLPVRFKARSLLEWLIKKIKENKEGILPLNATAAVQLPCSSLIGIDRNKPINELFNLMGVERVLRSFDYGNRLCCGARGYFGFLSGNINADADFSDMMVDKNIKDAAEAKAEYIVTFCPMCYAAIAPAAKKAGLIPIQIEGLVSRFLYGEDLPGGMVFS